MKIALIQPKLSVAADFTMPYTIAVLSAWLKNTRPKTEVFYTENIAEMLEADEIWCTSVSESWNTVNELGKIAVNEGKRFLVGGHHATALPQTLRHGEAFRGPVEGAGYPINSMPFPDWSILPDTQGRIYILMTSQGCPFHCSFCSSAAFWKRYIPKSPARVIAEIRQLRDLRVQRISIFDDLFTADKKRLREIVKRVKEEGLNSMVYSCNVRADTVDEEVIELLCEMNVREVAFGSESGSDFILKMMHKKTTVKQNLQLVLNFAKYGLKVAATSLVLGHPGESPATLQATKEYIELIRPFCGLITTYPLTPYPGTSIWEFFLRKHGIDVMAFDWSRLCLESVGVNWDNFFLLSDDCTVDDIKELYQWNMEFSHGA